MANVTDPNLEAAVAQPGASPAVHKARAQKSPSALKFGALAVLCIACAAIVVGSLSYSYSMDKDADINSGNIDGAEIGRNNPTSAEFTVIGLSSPGEAHFTDVSTDFLVSPNPLSIPEGAIVGHEFDLSVNNGGGWLGENLGDLKLGFRQRRRDPVTSKFTVPRSILRFVVDGMIQFRGELHDPSLMSLDDLKVYMLEMLSDELPEGVTDPFDDYRRFDVAGNICHCEVEASCDCKMVQEAMFKDLSGTSTDYTNEYYCNPLRPVTGEDDYTGEISSIEFSDTLHDIFHQNLLINENDLIAGQPEFRFKNSEVDEVFFLEAKKQRNFEVHPGRVMEIWGWRGGKVENFVFDDEGNLIDGVIIVGPHPETDVNDRVWFGEKRYGEFGYGYVPGDGNNFTFPDESPFSDLEIRTPGPEMRFTDGKNTRIYVHNRMEDDHEEKITVHWHGFDLPHDQDGVPFENQTPIHVNTTFVYEYQVPNYGGRWYHQHYNTRVTVGMGMFGPTPVEFPDDVKTWDREYVIQVSDVQSRFTMNGNTFPGTIERLSGHFKDVMRIDTSEPADDGSLDTIVTIVDERRSDLIVDIHHPVQLSPNPADGAPIREGTGSVDADGNHVHGGHQIINTDRAHGKRVQIEAHNEPNLNYPYATLNGYHYVTKEGNSMVQLRVPKVSGMGTSGGSGGVLYVWRKHKSSLEKPWLQNNGNSGAHFKMNFGEEIAMRWFNAAATPHPLHIHGHQWNIIAKDGNLLDSPVVHNVYLIPQAGTFEAKVCCNNPNRFGGWMIHCHNYNHLSNPDNPYPDGEEYPGGMLSHLDYTGFDRKKALVSDKFHAVHFNQMPATCTAADDFVAGRDIMGVAATKDSMFLTLDVEAHYGSNHVTKMPFGNVTGYAWDVLSAPDGLAAEIEMPLESRTRLSIGPDHADGEYIFQVAVEGKNAERFEEDDTTECLDDMMLTVTSNLMDDRSNSMITTHGTPTNIRLVPGAERGHITHPLFKAKLKTPDLLTVSVTDGLTLTDVPTADGESTETITFDAEAQYVPVDVLGEQRVYVNGNVKMARVMRDPKITTNGKLIDVDLVPNAERGTITQPLYKGTLEPADGSGARDMWFVVTDASTREVADLFGAIYSPVLSEAPVEAIEVDGSFEGLTVNADRVTNVVFRNDPGFTSRYDPDDATLSIPPVGNIDYSPMKRFVYNGVNVTINAPLIKWGDADGQQFIVDDAVGCDVRIRSNPPSPTWVGYGPPGCFEGQTPMERYKGGQALAIDLDGMTFKIKLSKATLRDNGIIPYYTVFEASTIPAAGFMGVIHAPKMNGLGRGVDTLTAAGVAGKKTNNAVATLRQFANGLRIWDGGPNGFQPGVVPFTGADASYTPMWHISWLLFNCGSVTLADGQTLRMDNVIASDQSEWMAGRNAVQGDVPVPGSGIPGFDPLETPFDPFQMTGGIKGSECTEYAKKVTGHHEGRLYLDEWQALKEAGQMFETDAPTGAELGGGKFLIVNCPLPITVNMNTQTPDNGLHLPSENTYEWRVVRKEDDFVLLTSTHTGDMPPDGVTDGQKWALATDGSEVPMTTVFDDGSSGPVRDVYFAVPDASDEEVAKIFGSIFSPVLSDAPDAACELGVNVGDLSTIIHSSKENRTAEIEFEYDPGYVSRMVDGVSMAPVANPEYSPLKRFLYNGRVVTINAPMIWWGEEVGQQYIPDVGGCMDETRSIPPSPKHVGGGPPGCTEDEHYLDRYRGGMALKVDIENFAVTMKLHKATLRNDGILPYYTVFDASAMPAADFMGVVHAPKLAALGRGIDTLTADGQFKKRTNTAVATLRQVANGLKVPEGGPSRFQPGVVPFSGAAGEYTPMWHITWLLYNCDDVIPEGESLFWDERNVLQGGAPVSGSGITGFDPAENPFDPFQVKGNLKGLECPEYAAEVTGNSDSYVYLGEWDQLIADGKMFETEAPTGAELGHDMFLIVNCPLPVTVDLNPPVSEEDDFVFEGEGRLIEFHADDNTAHWFVSIDGEVAAPVDPATVGSVNDGTVGTIAVRTGDTITFSASSPDTGHGLVFVEDLEEHTLTAEEEFLSMFAIDEELSSSKLGSTGDLKFLDQFGVEPFGVTSSEVGPKTMIVFTVQPGNVGRNMLFSCFVHGPAAMNGKLAIIG